MKVTKRFVYFTVCCVHFSQFSALPICALQLRACERVYVYFVHALLCDDFNCLRDWHSHCLRAQWADKNAVLTACQQHCLCEGVQLALCCCQGSASLTCQAQNSQQQQHQVTFPMHIVLTLNAHQSLRMFLLLIVLWICLSSNSEQRRRTFMNHFFTK